MENRSPSELQIQAKAWLTVWKELPLLRRCFFHVPNETAYNNGQQTSSGVTAGIQDMFLICRGNVWLIELKDDKGYLSDVQKVVHAIHKIQGFDTYVFRDADEVISFVKDCDKPGAKEIVPQFWRDRISPFSVAEDYEKLLKILQDKKQARRKK